MKILIGRRPTRCPHGCLRKLWCVPGDNMTLPMDAKAVEISPDLTTPASLYSTDDRLKLTDLVFDAKSANAATKKYVYTGPYHLARIEGKTWSPGSSPEADD